MKRDDLNEALRLLLAGFIDLQTQLTAMRLALEAHGILTYEVKTEVMKQAREVWRARREAVERLGATEEIDLEEFLSSFEGPLQ